MKRVWRKRKKNSKSAMHGYQYVQTDMVDADIPLGGVTQVPYVTKHGTRLMWVSMLRKDGKQHLVLHDTCKEAKLHVEAVTALEETA